MKEGLYPSNAAIVLDTNIISHARRRSFGIGVSGWIEECKRRGNDLILPQVAVYEYLRNVDDPQRFEKLQSELKTFGIGYCTPAVFHCALCLHVLYYSNEETRGFAQEDILNDLLIGAIAGKHETKTGKKTYIASCDQDFPMPYFLPYTYFSIPHDGRSEQSAVVYLYEVNIRFANEQWKEFRRAAKQS